MSDIQLAALHWGVKQSFRSYVEAMGGKIDLDGGAERVADGGFAFAPEAEPALVLGADGRPHGLARFSGEVRFEAHGGMLRVAITDPGVELGPAGGSLTVADPWAPGKRMEIAKLDVSAAQNASGEISLPASTTLDGMQLLGDHYPPGTQLDPVRLKVA